MVTLNSNKLNKKENKMYIYATNQFNKIVPAINRLTKWLIRAAFELLKLTGLGYMVMELIVASSTIEVGLSVIVVFSAVYITRKVR